MAARNGNSQTTDIAILKRDVGEIKSNVQKISDRMDSFDREYVKRGEMEAYEKANAKVAENLQHQISAHAQSISTEMVANAVFRSQVRTWGLVGSILVGIVSPIVVGVILHYMFQAA